MYTQGDEWRSEGKEIFGTVSTRLAKILRKNSEDFAAKTASEKIHAYGFGVCSVNESDLASQN